MADGFQRQLQVLRQLEDDAILQREDLVERAVDLDVAQHRAGIHLDEPRGDADLRSEALERARDDPARAQAAADLDRKPVVVRRLVRRVEVAQRVEHALAADDREALHVLEIGGHRLGDARADPLVGGLARDVGERDDGDGVFRRRGQAQVAAAARPDPTPAAPPRRASIAGASGPRRTTARPGSASRATSRARGGRPRPRPASRRS